MTEEFTVQRITVKDKQRLDAHARRENRSAPKQLTTVIDVYEALLEGKIPTIEFTGKGDEIGNALKSTPTQQPATGNL